MARSEEDDTEEDMVVGDASVFWAVDVGVAGVGDSGGGRFGGGLKQIVLEVDLTIGASGGGKDGAVAGGRGGRDGFWDNLGAGGGGGLGRSGRDGTLDKA